MVRLELDMMQERVPIASKREGISVVEESKNDKYVWQ